MAYRKRALLSVFVCLVPVLGHTNMGVVSVRGDDVSYFERINDSLRLLMRAVDVCQDGDDELYDCLCERSPAIIEQMDQSLSSAIERHPSWEERVLEYDGTTLQIPSLRMQVDDIQAQCEA